VVTDADPALATVLAWHAALNAGDLERLLALSSQDVEVGGPRGSTSGTQALRDWAVRAGIQLTPGRHVSVGPGRLVVEQAARWRAESGGLTEPQTVASVFGVVDGRVTSVVRYPDLEAALEAARSR
jgi:ketosteroid isomerase-like protein